MKQIERKETHKSIGLWRIVWIVLILLLFLIAAVFIIEKVCAGQSPGIHTAGEDPVHSDPVSVQSLQGYYTLSAYSLNGTEYAGNDLESSGYDTWYLRFKEDGSGFAYFMEYGPASFTCFGNSLRMEDGTEFPFEFSGESVILYCNAVLVFSKSTDTVENSERHSLANTNWHGIVDITKHSGKGNLKNGQYEVWGIIGVAEDGRSYFDIYDTEDYQIEDTPVLSMWVTVFDDHIEPDIGFEDAWLYDRWLTAADKEAFTLYYADDCLQTEYKYYYEKESCTIILALYPDP